MMELKIMKIEIEDILVNTEEKVWYLRDKEKEFGTEYLIERILDFLPDEKRKQWRDEYPGEVVSYYEDGDNFQELVELYEKHPERLEKGILPNQSLHVTFENTTSFSSGDFEEKGIKSAIAGCILAKLVITDIVTYEGPHSIIDNWMEYYIELIVPEDRRKSNRRVCNKIPDVLLLTAFQAHTEYGKVISYDYILKEEFGELNIYKKGKRDGISIIHEREEDTITFKINFKDKDFSFEVDLSKNSVKEVTA